jgi:hypothetical protein
VYIPLRSAPVPTFYISEQQAGIALGHHAIVVTARMGDPSRLVGPIRSELHAFDPQSTIDFSTARDLVASTITRQRLGMTLMLVFGAVALVLAAIGIYGVATTIAAIRASRVEATEALGG